MRVELVEIPSHSGELRPPVIVIIVIIFIKVVILFVTIILNFWFVVKIGGTFDLPSELCECPDCTLSGSVG